MPRRKRYLSKKQFIMENKNKPLVKTGDENPVNRTSTKTNTKEDIGKELTCVKSSRVISRMKKGKKYLILDYDLESYKIKDDSGEIIWLRHYYLE